jgi:hypothetical protein
MRSLQELRATKCGGLATGTQDGELCLNSAALCLGFGPSRPQTTGTGKWASDERIRLECGVADLSLRRNPNATNNYDNQSYRIAPPRRRRMGADYDGRLLTMMCGVSISPEFSGERVRL